MPLAAAMPSQTAPTSTSSAVSSVAEREGGLDARAARAGLAVGGQRGLGLAQVAEDALVDRPDHVEIGVRVAAQPIERAEQVGAIRRRPTEMSPSSAALKVEGGGMQQGGAPARSARASTRPSRSIR